MFAGDSTKTDLGAFDAAVSAVDAGCDLLAATPIGAVHDDELLAFVAEAQRLRSRLDAQLARAVATCEHRMLARQRRLRTTAHLVASTTPANPKGIRLAARIGTWIDTFAEFSAAFEAGKLSTDHLDVLRRADSTKTRTAMINDQALLVEQAQALSFVDFQTFVSRWIDIVNPDGSLPAEQIARSTIQFRTDPDGTVTIRGRLDPLAGSTLRRLVNAEAQRLYAKDQAEGIARSDGRRRADALVGMVRAGAKAGPAPLSAHVSIVMSETVAENLLTRLADPTIDAGLSWDDIDGRLATIDGTPLNPEYALAVFGVATFQRIIMDAESRPIDVSYNARSFPAWIKHVAQVVANGRCRSSGCDAPFAWLQSDHLEPHNKGGPTRLSNAQAMCGPDNLFKSDTSPDPERPQAA